MPVLKQIYSNSKQTKKKHIKKLPNVEENSLAYNNYKYASTQHKFQKKLFNLEKKNELELLHTVNGNEKHQ